MRIARQNVFRFDPVWPRRNEYATRRRVDLNGTLVGFRRWVLQEGFYFTREMYVVADRRRQGIAGLLIRSFEEWLLDRGQDIACISIVPGNSAMIGLARAVGYDGIAPSVEILLPLSRCLQHQRSGASIPTSRKAALSRS